MNTNADEQLKCNRYVIVMTSMTSLMYEGHVRQSGMIYHALQLISKPSQYEILSSEAFIALG